MSGRSVAAGYHNRPELTREMFHARLPGEDREYLRTGDLGFIRSGELFVTGRIKDLIIVNGRNIYPHDVEAAVVRADPAFRRAVAFSIDGNSSEELCVVAEAGIGEVTSGVVLEDGGVDCVQRHRGIRRTTSGPHLSQTNNTHDDQRKSPSTAGQADVPGQ